MFGGGLDKVVSEINWFALLVALRIVETDDTGRCTTALSVQVQVARKRLVLPEGEGVFLTIVVALAEPAGPSERLFVRLVPGEFAPA